MAYLWKTKFFTNLLLKKSERRSPHEGRLCTHFNVVFFSTTALRINVQSVEFAHKISNEPQYLIFINS